MRPSEGNLPKTVWLTPYTEGAEDAHNTFMTRLRGRRLLALGALGLVVVAFLAAIPIDLAIGNAPPPAESASYGGGGSVLGLVFAAPMVLLAALATNIVLRRDGNRIGWLLLAAIVSLAVGGIIQDYGTYAISVRHRAIPGGDLAAGLGAYGWVFFVAMVLVLPVQLFPDGRPLSRRWRWLVGITVGVVVVGYLGNTFGPGVSPGIRFPHATRGALGTALGLTRLALPAFALCALLGVASLALRYRRSSTEVRHQIRWLLLAGLLYVVPYAALITLMYAANLRLPWLAALSVIGLATVPFAMAIAVLKYRLYDIDIIINRAFVYGSLAALITASYVVIVVGIGSLVGSGGRPNLLLSIIATALVAVGFQPIRARVQRLANRLVYGNRATPYEVLAQFSERLADTYAADDVLPRMVRVLAEGTAAERAEVWLRRGEALILAARWPTLNASAGHTALPMIGQTLPAVPGADRVAAVRHQGEVLGAISMTKRPAEPLTPIEEKLIVDLANQAGVVLKNVGLAAELMQRLDDLRASRQRLVAAQDDERRRLERNLHDGAQQHLVALKVKLRLAEMAGPTNPEKAWRLIAEMKADADETLTTLQELARGIYPPLLADKGLVTALEGQARRATVAVEIAANGIGRYSQELEAAVYFCCLEALQNVSKYAGATKVQVRLCESDGALLFEIEDDGCGFEPAKTPRGSGLQNMSDRLDALGGRLEVTSAPRRGTTMRGLLPLGARAGV